MMKERLLRLFGCLIGSIFLIVLLYFISKQERNKSNGFIRILPSHKIIGQRFFDIGYGQFYIVGIDKKYIYLVNSIASNELLLIDRALKDTLHLKIEGPDLLKIYRGAKILIDSPNIYLADGLKPAILNGNLEDKKINKIIKTPFFTASLLLSSNTFILRSIYQGQNILVKQDVGSPIIKQAKSLLQKQVDGIFCTDGSLIKVPNSDKIIYTYYYRNEFICADTNLNLIYRGKTIDTVCTAHIRIGTISSDHQLTLAAPPLYVNGQCSATRERLFVHSVRKADNEIGEILDQVSIIDVYLVENGKYQFSVYLPNFKNIKMTDFKVFGKQIIALYDHYIYTYQLNF